MYRKILVPLDGSELAEKVLPHAEAIARCMGAEIILFRNPVYAYETTATIASPYRRAPLPLPDEREEALKEATAYLNKVKFGLSMRGFHVSTVVKEGAPAEAIILFAREAGVDLIAMSTHGRTGLSRVVFGSVAEEVLRGAGKPVLLIRSQP
jgi:nucleotide-binding universal stress UspA family protein